MTEMQESKLPAQFERFDGKNYGDWSFRTEAYLDKENVLELIETDLETLLKDFIVEDGDAERVRKRKNDSREELMRKNKRCKNIIIERVSNDVLEVIKEKKTAYEAWSALKERYEKTSVGTRIILSKQLSNIKYNPKEETFAEFNLKFDRIVRELKANGCQYDEIEKVTKLLMALPAEYESFKDPMLLVIGKEELTLNAIRKKIDDFEAARKDGKEPKKQSKQTTVTPVAFMARGGLSRSDPMFKNLCHNCKGFGHKKYECKKPGGGAFKGFLKSKFRGQNYLNRGRGGFGRSQDGGESSATAAVGHHGSSYSGYKRGGWNQDGRGRGRGYYNLRWNRGGGGRGSSAANTNNNLKSVPKQETAAMVQMDDEDYGDDSQFVYSFMCTEMEVNNIIYVDYPLSYGGSVSSLSANLTAQNELKFILDSGASKHLVQSNVPVSYKKRLRKPRIIQVAKSNVTLEAEFTGMLLCKTVVNGMTRNINIEVLLVENLSHNLLSISSLEKQGYEITFKNGNGFIIKDNITVAIGIREVTDLYSLTVKIGKASETAMSTKTDDVLWHRRLGHLACKNLNKLSDMVKGMGEVKYDNRELCDVCTQGKQKSLPFDGTRGKTSRILERVHSDVCGPFRPSYDGKKYFLTFIDDFSHFVVVYGLSRKSQVYDCFKNYFQRVTNRFGVKICNFRCDNGTEYINRQMMEFFSDNGIKLEPNIPYTPEHNGVSERMNQTLLERARCLLLGSSLNRSFWFECVLTAAYLINRSPTRAIEDPVTPAEVWFGVKPDLSKLRVFGCKTYVKKPDVQLDGKFDSRSKRAIFLGYCDNGYRLWSVDERKVIVAKNIICDESKSSFDGAKDNEVFDSDNSRTIKVEKDMTIEGENEEENVEELNDGELNEVINNIGPEIEEFEEQEEATGDLRRGSRVRMRPAYLNDYVTLASVANYVDREVEQDGSTDSVFVSVLSANECIDKIPLNFSELESSEDKGVWLKAVDAELQALEENKTWEFVELPQGRKPIKTKWVFTIKQDAEGKVDRYKARLVIKGCAQQEGIDYQETYAPVAHLSTVRIFLCLVNKENLYVHQLDVKNAFLNGVLQEDIFMFPPEGLKNVPSGKVCKLKKALYGLKQAPFEWNRKFNECVKAMGFKQCYSDRCLYVKMEEDVTIYLLLYVDDFLIACKSQTKLMKVKEILMTAFKMRDMGVASFFLGIKIQQTKEGVFLSQQNHVTKVLKKFKMDSSKPVKTPLDVAPSLNDISPSASDKPYRELVGSLMYTCMSTRPDICTAVNLFSQFQSNPKQEHWKGLTRILRYLQGTQELGLWYRGQSNYPLSLYVDADYANEPGRRSVTGFVIQVFGDSVVWGTRKQRSVALSTTEAEYIALATALSELLWVRQLLGEIGIEIKKPIPIFEDNRSCIDFVKSWEVKRMKHVDIKYNFAKELYQNKIIDVKYLSTEEQTADIFTKGLAYDKFAFHRESLGMSIVPK